MFKKTTLALAIAATALISAPSVMASEIADNATTSTNAFFDDASMSGAVGLFMRNRTRGNVDENGNDTAKTPNLDHGSLYMSVGFNSGYIADSVGLDLNVYTTFDLWQNYQLGRLTP